MWVGSAEGAAVLAGARRAVRLISVMKEGLLSVVPNLRFTGTGAAGNPGCGQTAAHMGRLSPV